MLENAERALIVAEDVLENITQLKKAAGKEKKRLLALDGTTADDMDRMKITIGARRSELRQDLANAVWKLEEHCEHLREAIAWSDSLVERGDDDGDDGNGGGGDGDGDSSGKVTVYLPPPVRRSSRQSI